MRAGRAAQIVSALIVAGSSVCHCAKAQSAPGDEHWDYRFGLPGVDGFVGVIATNGTDLYAGGDFTSIGNVLATDIAKWDGQNWSPLGSGMNASGQAYVFRVAFGPNGDLYAGGQFTSAGGVNATNVARWNGVTWSPSLLGRKPGSWRLGSPGFSCRSGAMAIAGGGPVWCVRFTFFLLA